MASHLSLHQLKKIPKIRLLTLAGCIVICLGWLGIPWLLAIGLGLLGLHLVGYLHQHDDLSDQPYSQQWSDHLFKYSADAILISDENHRVIKANHAFEAIYGFKQIEVIGKPVKEFLIADNQNHTFDEKLWSTLHTEGHWQGEIWQQRNDGEAFPSIQHISALKDRKGTIKEYIYIISDISVKKQNEEAIKQLSNYDQLCNLPNRSLFIDRLQHAMTRSKRSKAFTGLLFIDLDRFKYVNDSLGHDAGDKLLIEVARRLQATVREQDTVSRLGGDEFTVVLEDMAAAEDSKLVADKIIQELAKPIVVHKHEFVISSSIGISVYPDHGSNHETLIKNADTAMYQAKECGRNQYKYYNQKMSERASKKFHLESELRKALDEGHFELYYQAQVNLDDKRVTGAEALVRWQHPDKGTISPGDFIPLAEETGLIVPLGEWVLRTACRQAQGWTNKGYEDLNVSVNLSGRQLTNDNTFSLVKSILRESGLPAEKLIIEITESAVMSDPDRAIAELNMIRDLGVLIAIDDFGTGYSSLSYLKQLPVSCVKIDRSFTKDVHTDKDDAAIVNTIVAMTNSLGLKVLAEGVEGIEHIEYVSQAGCQDMQGYYFSRPLPEPEFLDFVSKFNKEHSFSPIQQQLS
ncbi:MAG: EAL domain-containing protein [Pseudomonadales bacterium]|nr:EAL domain-containing protein [Pseudomonadales bacterium]